MMDKCAQVGRLLMALRPANTEIGYVPTGGQQSVGPPRHPRGAATPASSSRAGSRPGRRTTSGGGPNMRWSSRASGRADRTASPGLTPTAIVIGHKAQIGKSSMASSPSH
jgi:hypothetical protein